MCSKPVAEAIHREVVDTVERLDEIWDQWRLVAGTTDLALNDPEWHASAALHTHESPEKLSIIVGWRDGRIVTIAPLVLARRHQGYRYEVIGARVLCEPAEVMATDPEAARWIAQQIRSLDYPVFLSRLPACGAFYSSLSDGAGQSIVVPVGASGSRFVDTAAGWESYYQSRPSKLRNTIRRAARGLARSGESEFEFIRPTDVQAPGVLRRAFEIERRSWKGRNGSAVLDRPDLLGFFLEYGGLMAARGELLVSFLKFNGEPIAMQVAAVSRSRYLQLKIGYDDSYAKHVPGLQLQLRTLQWTFDQNLACYEFLGSDETWLQDWTDSVRLYKSWLVYPRNIKGVAALLMDCCRRVGGLFGTGKRHRNATLSMKE